jgi:DNA mismatch repair ATPase MutS
MDISLESADPVSSSVELVDGHKPHAILTGPNGGGKSSFLRAALQCVLLGHTFGYAPAKEANMPRFTWIATGIQLRDTPGKLSMFETEVKFASDCLAASKRYGPGLVLFDELFHSTNPPDGVRTATQFLRKLWDCKDVFSIVSTHVFPLVSTAPNSVQALCCPAQVEENGTIKFSYKVQPGICMISSVHTVWEKFGLAERDEVRSEALEQTLPVKEKETNAE